MLSIRTTRGGALKVISITLALILALAGCKNINITKEVDLQSMEFYRALAIDKGEREPSGVSVTLAGIKGQPKDASEKKGNIEKVEAPTLSDAERFSQASEDKYAFWGHIGMYLFSEETAREDVYKYTDYLLRNPELRLNSKVYIARNSRAGAILNPSDKGDYFVPDRIELFAGDEYKKSKMASVNLIDFTQALSDPYGAAIVSALTLKPVQEQAEPSAQTLYQPMEQSGDEGAGETKQETDTSKTIVDCDGYAVFKDYKLIGYIEDNDAMYVNMLKNEFYIGNLIAEDSVGKKTSLELVRAKTSIKPHFYNDRLDFIEIKADVTGNVAEVGDKTEKIEDAARLEYLAGEQRKEIYWGISRVVEWIRTNNADCIGVADAIERNNPIRWRGIRNNWAEILPNLEFRVEVDSKVRGSYDINDPAGVK